jgi:hypothetical protein
MFEEWTVHNEIGNIYIGPGTAYHKIEVLQPYEGYRYTIGFDIITEPNKINWKYCPIPIT